MKEYLVTLPIEGSVTYRVKADNEREAKELAVDGVGDYVDIQWDFSDTECNPVEVEEV